MLSKAHALSGAPAYIEQYEDGVVAARQADQGVEHGHASSASAVVSSRAGKGRGHGREHVARGEG